MERVITIRRCGETEEYVWLDGGLMRKSEFRELLRKNPKKAIEKLVHTPAMERRIKRFIAASLASMERQRDGAAGSVAGRR
jgi:hypothetical protein